MKSNTYKGSGGSVGSTGSAQGKGRADEGDAEIDVDSFASSFPVELVNAVCGSAAKARAVPSAEELMFFAAADPSIRPMIEEYGDNCLRLVQLMMDISDNNNKFQIPENVQPDEFPYDSIVERTDELLEPVESYLDFSIDISKLSESSVTEFVTGNFRVHHAREVHRPQLEFEEQVDNSPNPFVPKLTEKPNALISLRQSLSKPTELSSELKSHISALGKTAPTSYPHPYMYELDCLQYTPEQLTVKREEMYLPLESTSCTWVDTVDILRNVSLKLDQVSEFAVDLEQHSYRSYQGFVCLMQLSTRNEDFLIDTLKLRSHMHILNSSFTNPKIVKVLHGSDSDIVWLQRDFGLYIVNMFDTGQAARVLDYPKFSLAFLLLHFCGVTANKEYQIADWRVRPLSKEMLQYAQCDTHYLLYIYDRLRNELLGRGNSSKNLLIAVLNRSRELCKKRYEKDLFIASKESVYNKASTRFNTTQMQVFEALYEWRDRTAREEDESPKYVLPDIMLLSIAQTMPETTQDLLACCQPFPTILVKTYAAELAKFILDIKSAPVSSTAPSSSPSLSFTNSSFFSGENPSIVCPSPIVNQLQSNLLQYGNANPFANTSSAPSHQLPMFLNTSALGPNSTQGTNSQAQNQQNQQQNVWNSSFHPFSQLPQERRAQFDTSNQDFSPAQSSSLFGLSSSNSRLMQTDSGDVQERLERVKSSFNDPSLFSRLPFSSSFSQSPSAPSTAAGASFPHSPSGPTNPSKPGLSTKKPVTPDSSPNPSDNSAYDIPRSMEEIYHLSNLNRKRNKEKKKLKEDSIKAGPPSPISFDDSDSEIVDDEDVQPAEDTESFIKKIGWPADYLSERADNEADGAKGKRTHRRTKSIANEAPSSPGSPSSKDRGRKQASKDKDPSARRKPKKAGCKTFPPKGFQAFDYQQADAAEFNQPQQQGGRPTTNKQGQVINVPNMGRVSHRARARGGKSHTYRSDNRHPASGRPHK